LDIPSLMAQVPDSDRFLTLDELNAALERLARDYPAIAATRRVGTSKLGEPIRMLSIGSGAHNALLFACPHPNEPIGAMMVHHFAQRLCADAELRDRFGYTWHLIGCVDPDGTRLNEGWFAGPFTPRHYARHFYRPSSDQQVEWTFPIAYKEHYFDRVLPETQMLMRVIDELKPELMASLHNAGFGGVYYYLSRAAEPLYDTLHALPAWEGLPLQLGEPEVPYARPFAPAIFPTLRVAAGYDYVEQNGGDPTATGIAGASSFEYAEPYGTFSIITEVAYFDEPRVNDQTPTGVRRRDAILQGLDLGDEGGDTLRAHLDAVAKDLKGDSPFAHSVDWWAGLGKLREAERSWATTSPETERPATVAELFSSIEQTQFLRLLGLGMLLRMLEGEIAIGNGTPAIRAQLIESTRVFEAWADRLEGSLAMRVVPIRKLVAVQLGAVLAAAEYLAAERDHAAVDTARRTAEHRPVAAE
jgi:hypothetical protein